MTDYSCKQLQRLLRIESDLAKADAKQDEHHEDTRNLLTEIGTELARISKIQAEVQDVTQRSLRAIFSRLDTLFSMVK